MNRTFFLKSLVGIALAPIVGAEVIGRLHTKTFITQEIYFDPILQRNIRLIKTVHGDIKLYESYLLNG